MIEKALAKLKRPTLPVIGWREYVALPGLGITWINAKVDTGARSSALHAFDIEHVLMDGKPMVRFSVHPVQRAATPTITALAEVVDERWIRSTSGHRDLRIVVTTEVEIAGQRWPIDLTLARRDVMGFRMLLGRQAIRRRFLVNAGRSYRSGIPEGAPRRQKRKTKA